MDMDMGMGSMDGCDINVGGCYYHGKYVPTGDEMMAYQAANIDPWADTVKYGYYGMWFIAAAIGLAGLMNIYNKWVERHRISSPAPGKTSTMKAKIYAAFRWANYVRLPYSTERLIAPLWTSGSFAQTFILGLGFVFCTAFCFGITYYYRPPFYGSSPLGLRSEWLAMAMLPFLFVFAQKRNLIGTLTGTPYQKLQVIHQGISGLHFYMSLVHTIAMSIRGQREMGLGGVIFVSGFAALAPLCWLCFASLPIFRTKAYEGFWVLHMSAAIAYLGTLWWHVASELDSNYYMYATFAVFGYGFLLRIGWLLYRNLTMHKATVTVSSTGAILISIRTRMRWGPGQHVMLRFFAVRPLESHPFSLASLPGSGDEHEMKFIIQPRSGFSRSLAQQVAKASGSAVFNVLVDGPLGEPESLRSYDSALLFAGGSGISHILPVFLDLVSCMRGESEHKSHCARVELVWAVRTLEALSWFEDDIAQALVGVPEGAVSVCVFVTGPSEDIFGGEYLDDEKAKTSSRIELSDGRPAIRSIVHERTREWTGRLGFASCGPTGFNTDCANATAAAQLDILAGAAKCDEVYLASEIFGW